jgi:uncharacterized integral membrane protein
VKDTKTRKEIRWPIGRRRSFRCHPAVLFAIMLVLLLVNSHQVDISVMGAHGRLLLGVALLLAAVLGILRVVIARTARMIIRES